MLLAESAQDVVVVTPAPTETPAPVRRMQPSSLLVEDSNDQRQVIEADKVRVLTGMSGRVTRYTLENDPALISPLVGQFRDELIAIGVCDRNDANRVGVALEEALLNAIYHGNLEISSDLKANGDDPFYALVRRRRFEEPYASRRVRVAARVTRSEATYRIADEGPGFDISKLPDPTDAEYLERPTGRGLLLMRAFTDDVTYNSTGNQVTLRKRRA